MGWLDLGGSGRLFVASRGGPPTVATGQTCSKMGQSQTPHGLITAGAQVGRFLDDFHCTLASDGPALNHHPSKPPSLVRPSFASLLSFCSSGELCGHRCAGQSIRPRRDPMHRDCSRPVQVVIFGTGARTMQTNTMMLQDIG